MPGKAPGKRIAAEEHLEIDLVEIDRRGGEIAVVELEGIPHDSQFEARALCRQLSLLLLPVEGIEDRRPRLPRRFVNLRDDQLEPAPPAIDPHGDVRHSDRLRALPVAGMEGEDRRRVVVLNPRCRPLRADLFKPALRLLDPILREEIVNDLQPVVVGEGCGVGQFGEEAVVLGVEALVDDLTLPPELELPGID